MEPYILLNCFPIWKAMERWQEREKDIWLFKNSLCFISIPLYVRHQDIFTVVNKRTWFLPSWSLLSEEKKKKKPEPRQRECDECFLWQGYAKPPVRGGKRALNLLLGSRKTSLSLWRTELKLESWIEISWWKGCKINENQWGQRS